MARPQNGINGNIPQQSFPFVAQGYNLNTEMQRNHGQNIYGSNDVQQIYSNFVPQAYSQQLNANSMNSIRWAHPMINNSQFAILPYPPQSQYGQCVYTQNFMPNQPYNFGQDQISSGQVNYTPTNRKSSPLVVSEPGSNEDIDLKKLSNQTVAEKKSKPLIDISISENKDRHKEENKDSFQLKNDKKLENIVEEKMENLSDIMNKQKDIIKEDLAVLDNSENNAEDSEQNIRPKEEKGEEYNSEHIEIKERNKETDINLEDITKIESSNENEDLDDDTTESNIEDDGILSSIEKDSPNYFLQIDIKESDATILRRKLIYDREFLVSLKSNSLCQKKPSNLPETCYFSEDIIYDESQNISCKKPTANHNYLNNNIKKQNQKYGLNTFQKSQKQSQPKLINLNQAAIPVLERLKSSYLPPQLRSKDKDIDPYNELKRNIKCNLNKITPQNFQDCLSEISKLNIKEKEEITCLINEIFIKAVQEEAYSVTYAQFCKRLALSYTEQHSFKGQLLKKCQDMFQTPIQEQLDNVRKEWLVKIDNESDLKIKSLYESDLEEQVKKAKDKYFGNIRFIGELFLHQLLAGKVILNCIMELLKGKNDADALLALCKLMETCGKQIDERQKETMNIFFHTMEELSKSKDLETRIRFKLKDIIDMRKRKWVLRHIQQEKKINPKTLEQQKEEALAEAELAANKLIASQNLVKKTNQKIHQNSVRRQITVPAKQISIKNLNFSKYVVDNKTVLGPARSNWTDGSGVKPKFHEADEWVAPQLPLARVISQSRSRDQSPQIKNNNRFMTLGSSEEASGTDSRSSSPPITKAYRIKKEVPMCDDERADVLFTDLMQSGGLDIESWKKIGDYKRIITKWIDDMLEKDQTCRHNIGDAFAHLIHTKAISHELLINSLQSFVSCIDDLIYDIPKLWTFFSEFLERFICDKSSDISFIETIFRPLLPNDNIAQCISMTVHAASSRLGHDIVGQVFHRSSLKWDQLVVNDWEAFVEGNNLHFTICGGAPFSQCGGCSLSFISTELESMLSKDERNEVIFDYLEKHIDKPTWKSCECSKTIMTCILKSMPTKPTTKVSSYLNDKFEIIRLVSQNKIENEIEVLKSVLDMAHEFNLEILTMIYDVIMTRRMVSDKAFRHYLDNVSLKSQTNYELTIPIISQLYRPKDHW